MTPGERAVWAAVYAATWSRMSTVAELSRRNWTQEQIAAESANEAGYALVALRRLAVAEHETAHMMCLSSEATAVLELDSHDSTAIQEPSDTEVSGLRMIRTGNVTDARIAGAADRWIDRVLELCKSKKVKP